MVFHQIVVWALDTQFFQLVQRHTAVDHAVYQPHNLGAADWLVRAEAAIRITFYPACIGRSVDIAVRPMPGGNVVEDIAALIIEAGKARRYDCELRAGDRRIRREFIFFRAVYNTDIIQCLDFLVEPVIRLDVLKGAVRHAPCKVRVFVIIKTVEYGSGFGAGHGRIRPHAFVWIADNISQVFVRIDIFNTLRVINVGVVLDLLR